ncbi:hypothetical protein GGX14DRAFT_363469 [Mycena pura]|uniref:Uncharacterized protein n=1 Tax=Mycena pura TaxID=153505 RepID=A0AAD6VE18_9AGAR|nr:hypothetical protein GGX14DRAFT_363469 [Mycena pura]
MGEDWTMVLQLWWQMEEGSGFPAKVMLYTKTHPTTNRPKAVGIWVKNARRGTPDINVKTMETEWWAWWNAINPKWRVHEGTLLKEVKGDWDVLRCPGQNGFLNVIICLKWWRLKMDSASDGWQRAVSDVKWVLGGMLG